MRLVLFALTLIAVALLVIDWKQTLAIFRAGRGEENPVIRWAYARWGTRGVDWYFACWVAAVLLADAFVPWAWVGIAVVAAVQAFVVIRNYRIGIRP